MSGDEEHRAPRYLTAGSYLDRTARGMLVAAGGVCVVLGAIGIVLPGLPTTPFLLLAAFCFSRSSERFHRWLLSHRWLGAYIRNFEEGRGMTRRDKVMTIGSIWLTIGVTVVFFVPLAWARATLVLIALGVSFYLARLPEPDGRAGEE